MFSMVIISTLKYRTTSIMISCKFILANYMPRIIQLLQKTLSYVFCYLFLFLVN